MPTRTGYSGYTWSRDSPIKLSKLQVKKVGIIGGGASGAIVLDSLIHEGHVSEIVLFERRSALGGIWLFDDKSKLDPVPIIEAGATRAQIDPPLANPFYSQNEGHELRKRENEQISQKLKLPPFAQERFEPTPAYQQMKTNIIEKMMTYSDEKHWGPAPGENYAEREVVQQYITRYINRHKDNEKVRLELGTTVEDVARVARVRSNENSRIEADSGTEGANGPDLPYRFRVTLRQRLADGTDLWYQEEFDSLVVATGHYHIPYIPKVLGSEIVQQKHPKVFEHAKFFVNGEKYKNQTVIVVGSRALGTDLTRFTADHAAQVYQLIRSVANTKKVLLRENVHIKPVIDQFRETKTGFEVVFADGSVVANPDHVLYATGYQFLYPFLERELGDITAQGHIVPKLYQHTFLVGEPLLSVVGVPTDAISFRAFEFQAILLVRYLAGKVALPLILAQEQWLQTRYKKHGAKRSYHTIGADDARPYMLELTELGKLEDPADFLGREFPVTTEEEVQEYVQAALARRDLWN